MQARFGFPTRILFGQGVVESLPFELSGIGGRRPLVVTDEGLVHITQLPLRNLCLRGTLITDAGLVHLKGLPLKTLVLGETLIQGDGLRYLSGLPLKVLDVAGTRIGDALKTFNYDWGRRVLGRGAIVMLISDGWDRGEKYETEATISGDTVMVGADQLNERIVDPGGVAASPSEARNLARSVHVEPSKPNRYADPK